jgi:hypothetical protein
MDKHEEPQASQKEETNKTEQLVVEPEVTAEELVPLGDLKTSLPTQKSLLDARVVFVIGKLYKTNIIDLYWIAPSVLPTSQLEALFS